MPSTTPTLILITGLPGSGKSTVAKILSERTAGIVLNSDEIRRELFPHKRLYTSQETQTVIIETEKRAEAFSRGGHTVILDALFTKQNARNWYRELAQRIGATFKVILVVAPEEHIRGRLEKRPHTNDPSEATFAYYLDRKKRFEAIQGEHIVIDNSGDLEMLRKTIELLYSALESES